MQTGQSVPLSRRNDRAVCHNHVIEPLGRFDICRALPDAKRAAGIRQLEACKLRVSLETGFEQVRAHAVMPLSNHLSRRLDDIEDGRRSRLIISSYRPASARHRNSPHHAESVFPPERPVCVLAHRQMRGRHASCGQDSRFRSGRAWGSKRYFAATAALELAAPHHVSRDLPRKDLERQCDVIGAIAITKQQRGLHDLSV